MLLETKDDRYRLDSLDRIKYLANYYNVSLRKTMKYKGKLYDYFKVFLRNSEGYGDNLNQLYNALLNFKGKKSFVV